jgi:hypothetical protein
MTPVGIEPTIAVEERPLGSASNIISVIFYNGQMQSVGVDNIFSTREIILLLLKLILFLFHKNPPLFLTFSEINPYCPRTDVVT